MKWRSFDARPIAVPGAIRITLPLISSGITTPARSRIVAVRSGMVTTPSRSVESLVRTPARKPGPTTATALKNRRCSRLSWGGVSDATINVSSDVRCASSHPKNPSVRRMVRSIQRARNAGSSPSSCSTRTVSPRSITTTRELAAK
jgi:hypothetical protein